MKLIDFDGKFHGYLHEWMEKNASRFARIEDMEAQMPEVYLRFINQRADWLEGGKTPAEYFAGMQDPDQMAQMLRAYEDQNIPTPDLLLERFVELGERSVTSLMAMVTDDQICGCLKATALNLLIEIGSDKPMEECLRIVDARQAEDELADVAAELLEALGEKPVPHMLARLETASPEAITTYLDLLCNFPGDERIYQYTVNEFLNRHDQRAMFASFLGKLGDERAIEPLTRVMQMSDINYLDYLEIANAIEMLGGDAGQRDREFAGDPYYESLKEM